MLHFKINKLHHSHFVYQLGKCYFPNITDRATGKSRGVGFVEMADEAASTKAIAGLDGATVEDRTISVSIAKPKEDRPSRGTGFNSGKSYNENRY